MRSTALHCGPVNTSSGHCSSSSIRISRAVLIYNNQGLGLRKIRNHLNQATGSINKLFIILNLKISCIWTSNRSYSENVYSLHSKCCPTNKQPLGTQGFWKLNFSWEAHNFFQSSFNMGEFFEKKKKSKYIQSFLRFLGDFLFGLYDFVLVR